MTSAEIQKGAWIGTLCLCILSVQNALFFYATHEGRVPDKNGHVYFAPTMVVFVEIFKAIISFVILCVQQYRKQGNSGSYTLLNDGMANEEGIEEEKERILSDDGSIPSSRIAATWTAVYNLIFSKAAWKLAIPATLYVVQTITAIVGAQNLDSTSFIIVSQLKFATTAVCTSIFLNRVIGLKRWYSIGTLSLGVLLVQLQGQSQLQNAVTKARNPVLGLSATVIACFISGFAAIFVEKILKNGTSNLWATNIQLGSFGFIPALLPVLLDAYRNGLQHPFLYMGFWAWTTVFANVTGGLVVALIMKYADNIKKSMAISMSIVLTFFITVASGKAEMKPMAMAGVAVVVGSILAYNRSAPPSPTLVSEPSSPEMAKEIPLTQVTIQAPITK